MDFGTGSHRDFQLQFLSGFHFNLTSNIGPERLIGWQERWDKEPASGQLVHVKRPVGIHWDSDDSLTERMWFDVRLQSDRQTFRQRGAGRHHQLPCDRTSLRQLELKVLIPFFPGADVQEVVLTVPHGPHLPGRDDIQPFHGLGIDMRQIGSSLDITRPARLLLPLFGQRVADALRNAD